MKVKTLMDGRLKADVLLFWIWACFRSLFHWSLHFSRLSRFSLLFSFPFLSLALLSSPLLFSRAQPNCFVIAEQPGGHVSGYIMSKVREQNNRTHPNQTTFIVRSITLLANTTPSKYKSKSDFLSFSMAFPIVFFRPDVVVV